MAQSLLVASDAQADTSPTGGFIALVDGVISSSFCHFKPVLGTWGYQEGDPITCIASCECSMIIVTLWTLRETLRGRRILWLVDK